MQQNDTLGPLALRLALDVRWGDMDALGHVNNTVYFRYMEQARISFFERMGIGSDPRGEGMMLVHAECNFRRAIVYPARIELRLHCGEAKRSSMPMYIAIVDHADANVLYADGKSIVVWVDFGINQSKPIPDAVRQRIAAARA